MLLSCLDISFRTKCTNLNKYHAWLNSVQTVRRNMLHSDAKKTYLFSFLQISNMMWTKVKLCTSQSNQKNADKMCLVEAECVDRKETCLMCITQLSGWWSRSRFVALIVLMLFFHTRVICWSRDPPCRTVGVIKKVRTTNMRNDSNYYYYLTDCG